MFGIHRRLAAAAGLVLAAGLIPATVRADDASTADVQAKIESLKARVAALDTASAPNAAQVNAAVDAVMQDAATRSQFLAAGDAGSGAGYNNGFFIKQGDFTLRPGLHMQFRNVTNYRTDAKNGDGDNIQNGFEIRRLRPELAGTAFSPDLSYVFVWDVNRSGGAVTLLDVIVKYQIDKDFAVQLGQYKNPLTHEELVSDKLGLAVERTLVNDLIAGGSTRRQAVSLIYGNYAAENPIWAHLQISDGPNSINTPFTDAGSNWGVTGRVEFKVSGDWKSYTDFSAKNVAGNADMLVIGAGAEASESNNLMLYRATVDASYKTTTGLGLYGAFILSDLDPRNTANDDNTLNWGLILQANYLLNPSVELFARYDWAHFEDDQANGDNNLHEIVAGVNYYLGADGKWFHKAKVTVDVGLLPNGSPTGVSGAGVLGGTNDTEIFVRAQFNLVL